MQGDGMTLPKFQTVFEWGMAGHSSGSIEPTQDVCLLFPTIGFMA